MKINIPTKNSMRKVAQDECNKTEKRVFQIIERLRKRVAYLEAKQMAKKLKLLTRNRT